jgi:hypothetical protein
MGFGDQLEERQELVVGVTGVAGVGGELPVATSSAANRMVVPLRM